MGSILQLLLPLTQELNGSEQSGVADQQEDLKAMLHRLKGVAQTISQASRPQVSCAHTNSKWGRERKRKQKADLVV